MGKAAARGGKVLVAAVMGCDAAKSRLWRSGSLPATTQLITAFRLFVCCRQKKKKKKRRYGRTKQVLIFLLMESLLYYLYTNKGRLSFFLMYVRKRSRCYRLFPFFGSLFYFSLTETTNTSYTRQVQKVSGRVLPYSLPNSLITHTYTKKCV